MAERLANHAPLPVVTAETAPFWTGGADGRLMIARCADCTRYHHPPLPICPYCRSVAVAAQPVSGRGTVDSFTINHQPWLPGMQVPFTIALVALDEDPAIRLTTDLVRQPPDAAFIGQRVRVLFERHDDVWLPLFEPDDA